MNWRPIALVAGAAVTLPAAALGAGHVPTWMERMMGQEPPAMRQMMDNPPPGMAQMMQTPGMEQAMQNGAARHGADDAVAGYATDDGRGPLSTCAKLRRLLLRPSMCSA